MAKKPAKKTAAKSKPKAAPAKKSKPTPKKAAGGTKIAAKPKSKAKASPKKPAKKTAPVPKKVVAVKALKKSPSVKSTPKKPVKQPAPKVATKANGTAAAATSKPSPAPVPPKVEIKKPESKPGKGTKAPFMPPAVNVKTVPLPKVKKSVLDAAPEIVIKQAFNPKRMPPFYKKQQQRLLELRSALYDAMDGMAKETLRSRPEGSDASVGGMHMGDAGSDAYDRDFALSMLSKEQDALYEISEALGRLDRGVYGVCELSGKKIPDERLEALPYTRYTRDMQEQIERDNMGGRFRRPVVRSVFGLDDAAEDDEEEEGETPKEAPPQESSLDFMKE